MASPKRNANRPKFDRKPIDIEDLTNASAFGGIRDVIESHFGKPETSGGPEPADPDAPAADGSEAPPVFETDPSRLEYLWNPKESPISVRLGAELIGRLEKESLDIFRAITNRGSEIGGLLLGRVAPGRPSIVIVEDFEPIACGYTLGPTFLLSGDEQQRMREAIAQRKPGDDLQVVGFFRSNTRPVLSMAEEDSVLLDRLFPEEHHIFLLAKPFSRKPCQGAIFVREDRKFQGEASHQEFPFSKAELEKLGQLEPAILVPSGGASRVTPIRPAAPASVPEPPKPAAPAGPEPARPAAIAPLVESKPEPQKPPAPASPEPARPAAIAPLVESKPEPQKPPAPASPEPALPAAIAPLVESKPEPAAAVRVEEKIETSVETKIEPKVEPSVPPGPVTRVAPSAPPSAQTPARPVWRFKPVVKPPVPPASPAQPVPPAESATALKIQPAAKPPVPPALPAQPARPVPSPVESAKAPQPPLVQPAAKPPGPPVLPAQPAHPVPQPTESAKAPQPPRVQPALKPSVPLPPPAPPARPVPPPAESAKAAEPKAAPSAKPPVQPVAAAQPMRPAPAPVEPPKAAEPKVPPPAKPPVQPVAAAQPVRPAPSPAEPPKATEQKKPRAETVLEPAPPVEKAVPEFRFGAEDASSGRSRGPWLMIGLVLLVVGVGLFFLLRPSQPIGPPAPAPAANAAAQSQDLQLLVEAADSTFLTIRWNSSNPAVAAAPGGSLTFVDGGVKSPPVALSSADLKLGAYRYKPHSNDLAIRLEVSGAPGSPSVFAAQRILGAIRMLAPAPR
jgi:hypothetical protein